MKKLIRVFAGITLLLNIPLTAQIRLDDASLVKPRTPKIVHSPDTYHFGVYGSVLRSKPQIVHSPGTYDFGVDGSVPRSKTRIVHSPGTYDFGVDGSVPRSKPQIVHSPGTYDFGVDGSVLKALKPPEYPIFPPAPMPQVTLLPLKPSPALRHEWLMMPDGSQKLLVFPNRCRNCSSSDDK